MTPRRILAPIDFSDLSRMALVEADLMAERNGAILTLFHAHRVVQGVVLDATLYTSPDRLAPEIAALEDKLTAWGRELKTPQSQIERKVVIGGPVEEIVRESDRQDIIVIATHGRTGLSHFLMGSVSERVVRAARCSVLVVKHPSRDA